MDIESLIKKINGRKNNPISLSTTKLGKNIPTSYLMSMILAFDGIEIR